MGRMDSIRERVEELEQQANARMEGAYRAMMVVSWQLSERREARQGMAADGVSSWVLVTHTTAYGIGRTGAKAGSHWRSMSSNAAAHRCASAARCIIASSVASA